MITELTKEQESHLHQVIEDWQKIVRTVRPSNKEKAEASIYRVYEAVKQKKPKIFWCQSPAMATLVPTIAQRATIRTWKQVQALTEKPLEELREMAKGSESLLSNSGPYGIFSAYAMAYYQFFRDIGVEFDKETATVFEAYEDCIKETGWVQLFEQACFLSVRPSVCETEIVNNVLRPHASEGPAIAFPDGFAVYVSHGVTMEEWQVMTPISEMAGEKVLGIENAEQRAQVIGRIGIERFIGMTKHKLLDEKGDYQLLDVRLSDDVPHTRYLKMRNPSVGIYHVEGVGIECNTVQQALNWRAGDINTDWTPSQLT